MLNNDQNHRLDLNLLAIFDAVMSEHSLTKAGRRLGITQSAVSHALARLREVTGDPLFERTGRGVRPTPRATEMEAAVRTSLDQLRAALRSKRDSFDLAHAERTFIVVIPVGLESILLPRLARCAADAAGVKFRVISGRASTSMQELRSGDTWLALDVEDPLTEGYRSQLLFKEPFVIVARKDHPALRTPLDVERFEALPHIMAEWGREPGPTPATQRLQGQGLRRRVRYAVPNLLTMAMLAATTDAIGMMPAKVARALTSIAAIDVHPMPVEIPPLPIYMVWHEIFERDDGHRWLRQQFKEVCEAL